MTSLSILSPSFTNQENITVGLSKTTDGTVAYIDGLVSGLDLLRHKKIIQTQSKSIVNHNEVKIFLSSGYTENYISNLSIGNNLPSLDYQGLYSYLVKSITSSKAHDNMIRRLESLRSLIDGWAGDESLAPSGKAIDEAKFILLHYIHNKSLKQPKIRAISDGEVNFYWDNDGFLIDMAFFGEGEYSYYYKNKVNGEEVYDDVSIDKGLSQKIIALLSW